MTGCGLSHAIPNFTAAGIVTPAALAELDLAHYEALGVSSPEDRRKLFYLVQRIKLAVEKERKEPESKEMGASLEEQVDALVQSTTTTTTTPLASSPARSTANPSKENESPVGDLQSHGQSTKQDQELFNKPSNLQTPSSSPSKASPSKDSSSPSRIPAPSSKRSPSRLTSPKASAASLANQATTSPGETTTPVKNPLKSASGKRDSSSDDADVGGSSTWEDGDEDECADDEASFAVTTKATAAQRRSKRLSDKSKATVATTKNTKRSISPKKRTLAKPKIAAAGAKSIQTKSKVGKTSSALPRPAARSTRSQLQNPSKSMRTGKQLSTIPADSIAPMSPLTKMPPPQLEAQKQPEVAKPRYGVAGKPGISSKTVKSKSRRSLSGSVSDHSDSESSRSRERSRRTTMGGRQSRGSMSDSDSSVSRRRRQTMGRLQAPKAKSSGVTKGRTSDIGKNKSSTRPNGMAAKKTSKKTIHGTSNSESSWKAQIDALRGEVSLDHELFADSMFPEEDDDAEDDLIRVIVRKRPFSADKPSDIDVIHPLEYGFYGKMLVYQPTTRVDLTREVNTVPFAFDGVFGEQYNNLQIYEKSVRNLIPVVLDGQHATVFAFGCTGSGVSVSLIDLLCIVH